MAFDSLKVPRFQRFGFNRQPAPLHLGEILTYHVIDGSVKSTDLVAGEVQTLNGRSLDVSVAGGAAVVKAVQVEHHQVDPGFESAWLSTS